MTTTSAPQRLYLMQIYKVPPINLPIVCYLVQTNDGRNILIDSGLAPGTQAPPGMGTPILFGTVVEQLARIGLQPADIDTLICTHFHPDHCGFHEVFTNAQYVMQRAHYEHAQKAPHFQATRAHWDLPVERIRFVEGDTELLPGLTLLETSGHTIGHQSVLVRLPETGPVLLAIDAVVREENFRSDVQRSPMDEDETLLQASTQKLLDLKAHEQVNLVIFGHDGAQWDTLAKLPTPYC